MNNTKIILYDCLHIYKILKEVNDVLKLDLVNIENRKDLEDVPAHVAKDLTFHFAKEIGDVLNVAVPKV